MKHHESSFLDIDYIAQYFDNGGVANLEEEPCGTT
jgi:hypothetical protein